MIPTPRYDVWGRYRRNPIITARVVTPPTASGISLDDLKGHLRIRDHQDASEDGDLELLIASAREFVEADTGRSLVDQVLELRLREYPWSASFGSPGIALLRPPVIDVVSVSYTDQDGTITTLPEADYLIDDGDGDAPFLVPGDGVTWPSTRAGAGSVVVRYRAGYANLSGSPADDPREKVPANLRVAMLLHAEAHWGRDEKMMEKIIERARSLCNPYRVSHGIA